MSLRLLTEVVLGAAVMVLWLPALSELFALFSTRRPEPASDAGTPRLLLLVPAHDEHGLISACARSLVAMDYPASHRRIVVVADNCSDDTAALARAAGAEAFERHDPSLPGKPRALAWAIAQVPADQWDACVIVDADSTVHPGFARALARCAPLEGRAVQAYFGSLNEWDSWLTRLAGVLARARYEITYPLKRRAGLNCPLTGNGMCIGRDLLGDGWRWFSLTENWELYGEFTARSIPIEYASGALLYSQEARSMKQGGTQRRRWLAGRIGVLRQWGGRILGSSQVSWHQKLDALVELGGPSPVLHLVLALVVSAAACLTLDGNARLWFATLAVGSLAGTVGTTLAVLARHPQPGPTIAAFAMLPFYAVWRTATALRTVVNLRDNAWRKTSR